MIDSETVVFLFKQLENNCTGKEKGRHCELGL